jgi:hypothetical protein
MVMQITIIAMVAAGAFGVKNHSIKFISTSLSIILGFPYPFLFPLALITIFVGVLVKTANDLIISLGNNNLSLAVQPRK